MKRFILLLLLALVASPAAYAGSVADPSTPAILVNDSGGDTRTLPLPVVDGGAATTTAAITALAAQQASESLANLAAIATVTLDMASLSSDIGRVETETASGGAAVTAAVTALAAQQASEALAIQAAIATITLPVSAYSTTFITATETPTLVPLLAGVTEMTLVATGTFEVYLGSGAVTASATSIYNMTLPVSPGMAVYVGQSSAALSRITIYQVAR
jgi:hypothetical protein